MTTARDALAVLLDHAAEQLDDAPTRPPEPPEERPAVFGARHLSAAAEAALRDVQRERPVTRAWAGSAASAIRAWVASIDEGASLRSTSDPDRANRVQTSSDPSLGGREHDRIERFATVARAVGRSRDRVLALSVACPLLDPDQAVHVGLLAIAGRLVHRSVGLRGQTLRGTHPVRLETTPIEIVDIVRERWAVRIEQEHVRACKSHVLDAVRDALLGSGELRAVGTTAPRVAKTWDPLARLRAMEATT